MDSNQWVRLRVFQIVKSHQDLILNLIQIIKPGSQPTFWTTKNKLRVTSLNNLWNNHLSLIKLWTLLTSILQITIWEKLIIMITPSKIQLERSSKTLIWYQITTRWTRASVISNPVSLKNSRFRKKKMLTLAHQLEMAIGFSYMLPTKRIEIAVRIIQ